MRCVGVECKGGVGSNAFRLHLATEGTRFVGFVLYSLEGLSKPREISRLEPNTPRVRAQIVASRSFVVIVGRQRVFCSIK
jgi:hypothetical protein